MASASVVTQTQLIVLSKQRNEGSIAVAQVFKIVMDRGRRLDVDPTDSFQGLFKTRALPFRLNALLEVLQRTASTVFGKDARRFPRTWSGNERFEMARKPLRLLALQQLHLGLFTWKQLGNDHHPALPARESEALVVEISSPER